MLQLLIKLPPFCILLLLFMPVSQLPGTPFNVRDYGATGDGETIDSAAINAAIEAASDKGGGTVWIPAGAYASYTIRLKSNITLYLDNGATLLAAYPSEDGSVGYDAPEPNPWGELKYQDFGHSHFRNSLIWGEELDNVTIAGPGIIDGRGLVGAHRILLPGEIDPTPDANGYRTAQNPGQGNKAIALKSCRNITLKDFTMFRGGHFALLATGIDNLTIDGLKVDTNRDGFDIDACRNVRISNCSVNSPHDDAIVLKSSYALGEARPTENVTIANCQVSGYSIGTLLDGTFDRSFQRATDQDGPTGRIKFGTESNGGFKNIVITNCVFDRSRGLALETVDGGVIEDVTISNLVMRDIVNAPFFFRIGNRARGPEDTPVGAIRRVSVSNVFVNGADARYASQIVGLPGHPVEDLRLSDIHIVYHGGLSLDEVAQQPRELVNPFFLRRGDPEAMGPREPFNVPEQAKAYPEPSMFGLLPAYGLYARHAANIEIRDVTFEFTNTDTRPAVVLNDVDNIEFTHFNAETAGEAPLFHITNTRSFSTFRVPGVADQQRAEIESDSLR